jgi:hypothetical protein
MNGLDLFWYKNLNVFLACNNDTVDACDVSRCPLFLIGVEGYGWRQFDVQLEYIYPI